MKKRKDYTDHEYAEIMTNFDESVQKYMHHYISKYLVPEDHGNAIGKLLISLTAQLTASSISETTSKADLMQHFLFKVNHLVDQLTGCIMCEAETESEHHKCH